MAKKGKSSAPAPPPPEPPKKGGKKGKEDKNNAPPLDPRELSNAQRKQGRLAVTQSSSWTGKLPSTLLHEFCQKSKWNKVDYDMKKVQNKFKTQEDELDSGFIAWVKLSWLNPKTNESLEVIMKPNPEIIKPQETALEARHFAATYALHRLSSEKNMSMILPPNHRKIWSDLDTKRKEMLKKEPLKAKDEYNSNPFAVLLEKRKAQEKRAKEEGARQTLENKTKKPTIVIGSTKSVIQAKKATTNSKASSGNNINSILEQSEDKETSHPTFDKQLLNKNTTFPKKVWNETVFIDLNTNSRMLVEDIIKKYLNLLDTEVTPSKESKVADQSYTSLLDKLGFRKSHIDESLNYTSSFAESLEWLIFHVPEDDLPSIFVKDDAHSNLQLKVTKDLKKEYAMQRLSLGGFSRNEITTAMDNCDNDEVAAGVYLSQHLISYVPENTSDEIDDETSQVQWDEEIESLVTIYSEDKIRKVNNNKNIIDIMLSPYKLDANVMALRVYKSHHYPFTIPGIHLVIMNESYRLPNYIKVSTISHLLKYVIDSNCIGDPFLFSCIDWIENNLTKIIDNPGPLFDPAILESFDHLDKHDDGISLKSSAKSPNKSTKSKYSRSERELKEIKQRYEELQKSPKMKESLKQRKTLPASNKEKELINIINSNKVCLVTGETGSGKSTQIVQFILDNLNAKGDFDTNIICTQPRRISAIGLANRISDERIEKVGQETGYIIRGENKTSKATRISFVTTGLLLRMIQGVLSPTKDDSESSNFFMNLGYIFIDEVHERSIDNDFLLIILKTIMHKYPKLKIILMSATIDINVFKNYFPTEINHIHIEGRTFPIKDYYLDSILEELQFRTKATRINYGYNDDKDQEWIQPKATSSYFQQGNINYDLIAQLVENIDQKLTREGNNGSILIFLPGVMEITKCMKAVNSLSSGKDSFWFLPLHSALSSADQKRIFDSPPRGKRKIVASTNIAETSITIPDAVVVVDTGRVKNVFFDAKYNSTKLLEGWCSQAEVGQRRGRAGRITAGTAYRLYSQETETERMLKQPIPEIKRTRLESVYLIIKAMGISDVYGFLKRGLDPPSLSNVNSARQLLSEIGALHNDRLTGLGSYLSLLPTDFKSGKLLIFGNLFGCLESCLTLAALSVSGNPFMVHNGSSGVDNRAEVKSIQLSFSNGQGDHIAIVNAFNEYLSLEPKKRKKWLTENSLSYMKMNDLMSTREQYVSILQDLGFVPLDYSKSSPAYASLNRNSSNYNIIRSLIASASYPQIARVELPQTKYLTTVSGAVASDPDARQTKFWIRNEEYIAEKMKETTPSADDKSKPMVFPATRSFIHPSSTLFVSTSRNKNDTSVTIDDIQLDANDNYVFSPSLSSSTPASQISSSFVAFDSSQSTNKLYIRDLTPTSILSVLLFGGAIAYDLSQLSTGKPSPGIVMDGWLPIRTWCKNGVLIVKLRQLLDQIIKRKIETPAYQSSDLIPVGDDVLKVVEKILTVENK